MSDAKSREAQGATLLDVLIDSATADLSGPTLTAVQTRISGTTTKNGCHPGTEARTIDALGDGSASRPLLTLHR